MRRGIFTVLFMLSTTVVFIAVLAFLNERTRDRIRQNIEIQRIQSIMYACHVLPQGVDEKNLSSTSTTADIPWNQEELLEIMKRRMRRTRLGIPEEDKGLLRNSMLSYKDSVDVYVLLDDGGGISAYGFPLKGKGLWGLISAFGVVDAGLNHMLGIDFTDQVETPGLGARITEQEFKYFFRNLDLSGFLADQEMPPPIIMIRQKKQTNLEFKTNSIQAITGATQTCNGVVNMLNADLRFYLSILRQNKERLETLFS